MNNLTPEPPHSLRDLQGIVESSDDAIVGKNLQGIVTSWNSGARKVFGYEAAEILGRPVTVLIPPDRFHEEDELLKRIRCGESVPNYETVRLRKDGRPIETSISVTPIKDPRGQVVGAFKIARDISARKLAERNLRASEERMQFAMELLETGEWEVNLDDHTAHRSARHDRIFGYDTLLSEWTYEMFLEHVVPEDRARVDMQFRDALAAQKQWDVECRITRHDGIQRWIRAAGRHCPSDGDTSNRLVGFVQDITARKQEEEESRDFHGRLTEIQKLESLGILAGGIAHDFNNLLTGVIGNASLIRFELPQSSHLFPFLDQIDAASMRAADLCRQMLAYAGKGRYVVQKIDLTELVKETVVLLHSSVDKNAIIHFNLASNLPATLADATQLQQIVMNLVINASEALGGKNGAIRVTTGSLRADRSYLSTTALAPDLPEGDYVFLEVSNTGSGMSKETIAKIFDPFFSTKFTGRGLGLAAVLGIVRGHKGSLKVYSEPGTGTTFKILLPATPEPAARLEIVSTPSAADAWHGSGTILVVDDEQIVRATVNDMLKSIGFHVLLACDGLEGVECFRSFTGKISAVLLDLTMPRLDGEGAFREIRLYASDVPVILMSGFNEQDAINRFTGKGLAGFLHKPFKLEILRTHLQKILA